MKIRALLLLLMIGWDMSLHWVELLGKESIHFLYPIFPLMGISYNVFWTVFWTLGFIITLTLLGSGTTKNKTIINNYIPKSEIKVEEPTEELKKEVSLK